jgi:hypothetical protein
MLPLPRQPEVGSLMCELSRLDENKEMTMRKLQFFVLLASALFVSACSSGGSDSPSDTNVHLQSWFSAHAPEALADPGYDECKQCHAPDLRGSGDAVSCYSCHSYNTEPPFSIHPTSWTDSYFDHRGYAAVNGFNTCTPCHGSTLQGYQTAPSCYSTSFNGQSCHSDGPQGVPHPLDESYLSGTNHGPDAKADLTVCQSCHGQPGGPGSNPRFNIGIERAGNQGCESCHGEDNAHPPEWAGPNNTFHYSANNIDNACTLCHGVNLDGVDGVGVSCLGCHDSVTIFTLDCTFCHGYAPDGSDDLDVPIPVNHSGVPSAPHDVCAWCHGMKEDGSGGWFAPYQNYLLFDYANDGIGDHWDGNININANWDYNPISNDCTNSCHGPGPALPNGSGLPIVEEDYKP